MKTEKSYTVALYIYRACPLPFTLRNHRSSDWSLRPEPPDDRTRLQPCHRHVTLARPPSPTPSDLCRIRTRIIILYKSCPARHNPPATAAAAVGAGRKGLIHLSAAFRCAAAAAGRILYRCGAGTTANVQISLPTTTTTTTTALWNDTKNKGSAGNWTILYIIRVNRMCAAHTAGLRTWKVLPWRKIYRRQKFVGRLTVCYVYMMTDINMYKTNIERTYDAPLTPTFSRLTSWHILLCCSSGSADTPPPSWTDESWRRTILL